MGPVDWRVAYHRQQQSKLNRQHLIQDSDCLEAKSACPENRIYPTARRVLQAPAWLRESQRLCQNGEHKWENSCLLELRQRRHAIFDKNREQQGTRAREWQVCKAYHCCGRAAAKILAQGTVALLWSQAIVWGVARRDADIPQRRKTKDWGAEETLRRREEVPRQAPIPWLSPKDSWWALTTLEFRSRWKDPWRGLEAAREDD